MTEGDVLVWEYSLLDSLLTKDAFAEDDVHAARRMAWRRLMERNVSTFVLMTPHLQSPTTRTACEDLIAADASAFGLCCLDVRELFASLGIHNLEPHYRDDRHPRHDSPVVDAIVEKVLGYLRITHGTLAPAIPAPPMPGREQHWRWLDARELARMAGRKPRQFSNSFLKTQAIILRSDEAIDVPQASRIVALGVLSTHDSGGAWCGHPGCPPASTRLQAELDYSFLLRSTGILCVRRAIDKVASAPAWAYGRGTWAGYGQALSSAPGRLLVFGMLYEPAIGVPVADANANSAMTSHSRPRPALVARLRWRLRSLMGRH